MKIQRVLAVFIAVCFIFAMLAGCSSNKKEEEASNANGLTETVSGSDGEFLGTTGSGDETSELTSYITEGTTQQTTAAKTTDKTTTEKQIVSVTIPEGYSFMQIAETLEDKGVCRGHYYVGLGISPGDFPAGVGDARGRIARLRLGQNVVFGDFRQLLCYQVYIIYRRDDPEIPDVANRQETFYGHPDH